MATQGGATVRIVGLEELIRNVGWARTAGFLRPAMERAVRLVKAEAQIYPPARRQRMGWKSERQRRFVMAGIRSGAIEVPYRRGQSPQSEKLGNRWTTEIRESSDDLVGVVGNNASYGPYVMDDKLQAAYHAGNWPTLSEIVTDVTPDVEAAFGDVVQRELDRF